MAEKQRGGGIITKEDLRRYKPEWRTPIKATYRGYTLLAMPPSSSGGITMTETLNILENFAPLPPAGSVEYAHLLAESFRRAFIDRNTKLGDPAFVKNPLSELTSKAYAKALAAQIDLDHASKTPAFDTKAEGMETTHYSVVDAEGNAVATTTTLNGGYGSGVWVRGGGFFLNNEMDDFAAQPGTPNMFGLVQGEANAIRPGKRMLSAMEPTIVLDPQGKLLMVMGAAGGPTIITATTEVILNVIEHHMTLADAMRAPRAAPPVAAGYVALRGQRTERGDDRLAEGDGPRGRAQPGRAGERELDPARARRLARCERAAKRGSGGRLLVRQQADAQRRIQANHERFRSRHAAVIGSRTRGHRGSGRRTDRSAHHGRPGVLPEQLAG